MKLPEPPYWAVIFSNQRRRDNPELEAAYDSTAARMVELAQGRAGYLGIDSVRGADGFGITVSYWRDLDDIASWRRELEHAAARERGRRDWYDGYELRVAQVMRGYDWSRDQGRPEDPAP